VGQNWYQSRGNALVLSLWTFFFYFKGQPFWILQKTVLLPLEPNLLVIWERIGEALKVVYGAYHFTETQY
jgi:hypothetical protein